MYFNDIRLKNFRNYKNISINLHKDLNILIGNNGEGKTNILESIYFLSLLKSHRTIKLNDLINFKEEYTEIFTNITNDNDKKIVTYLKFDKLKGKNVSINNLDINRLADL
ncbi:DNA replication and repair protein recF [Candidatus Arthromitus sp. SFB-3]|nr:DNA replication and repair protein recF [Candidatus Arthromitus sp. SFB-3]